MAGSDTNPSDSEHDRALMRAFEMRHPMLALAVRLIRRRPLSGVFVAAFFIGASTIAYEGTGVLNKRFNTWLDVNYTGAWEAHDKIVAMKKGAALAKSRTLHEGVAVVVPEGRHVVVRYNGIQWQGQEPWTALPGSDSDGGNNDLSYFIEDSAGHSFRLPPGDRIAAMRTSDGSVAQVPIDGQPFVLVHVMWEAKDPSLQTFPADFRERKAQCGAATPANCTIYGVISRADFDAIGGKVADQSNPAVQSAPPADANSNHE
jgi:hypothetical protein